MNRWFIDSAWRRKPRAGPGRPHASYKEAIDLYILERAEEMYRQGPVGAVDAIRCAAKEAWLRPQRITVAGVAGWSPSPLQDTALGRALEPDQNLSSGGYSFGGFSFGGLHALSVRKANWPPKVRGKRMPKAK